MICIFKCEFVYNNGHSCVQYELNDILKTNHSAVIGILSINHMMIMPWGSFHKAILATIDLSYLRLILRLLALIFTSVPRNNFHLTG